MNTASDKAQLLTSYSDGVRIFRNRCNDTCLSLYMENFGLATLAHTLKERSHTTMKPCTFYVGQLLSVCGACLFLLGVASDSWVTLSSSTDLHEERQQQLVAKFGPWQACSHGGYCDDPWVVLDGVDERSTRIIQMIITTAILAYLISMSFMVLQTTMPKVLRRRWRAVKNLVVVEIMLPSAAVTGFTAMLLMGYMKQKVIGHGNQMERIGSGFLLTLLAIILTVIGSMCMILSRYAVKDSSKSLYVKMRRAVKQRKRKLVNKKKHHGQAKITEADKFLFNSSSGELLVPPARNILGEEDFVLGKVFNVPEATDAEKMMQQQNASEHYSTSKNKTDQTISSTSVDLATLSVMEWLKPPEKCFSTINIVPEATSTEK